MRVQIIANRAAARCTAPAKALLADRGDWKEPFRFCDFSGQWIDRVTNMSRPAENVVSFYNKRGTCEQWIKEGKGAIKWTRLSCRSFAANAVRLQLHALAYNLGNFLRTLATPEPIKEWSLTSLKEKLIKIGAKVVSHGRYVAFQMAEVAIPKNLFADILRLIAQLRPPPNAAPA
jgi:Transposase DDE domain group 1